MLRPDSTEQVAAIMKLCNEARIGVVPVGGNTSYCGGATPSATARRSCCPSRACGASARSIRANYTMIAEAGCVLAEIQAAAASVDRLFPMSLGSEGSCQLGGNLSTNAGGTAVLRYGMMRDLVLGLEVVLPDGRVLEGLKPLRKDNTGYDLRDLFIGAEGTLGIITAAACKLFSRPAWTLTAFVGVPEPQAAVALLSRLRAFTSDAVTTFELVPRIALELVLQHVAGHERSARSAASVVRPAGDRHGPRRRGRAREHRSRARGRDGSRRDRRCSDRGERGAARDVLAAARIDSRSAAPRRREHQARHLGDDRRAAALHRRGRRSCSRELAPGARLVSYGHLGDGNLHFNLSPPRGGNDEEFLRLAPQVNRAVHDLVARYGGSFSAEHGIGQLKRAELLRYKHPVAIELMRSIKQAVDPNGIMNPGKVL